jgi:hypothetical protein
MKSHNRSRNMKWHQTTDSCDRSTGQKSPSSYGHATYSCKVGDFIYRVEGVISELSETGCSIRGTPPQVVGSRMRVMLSLNDQQAPLCVNATVCWFADESFGLKFPQLRPHDVARLQTQAQNRLS